MLNIEETLVWTVDYPIRDYYAVIFLFNTIS